MLLGEFGGNRSRPLAVVSLATAVALAAAGCGGGGDTSTTASTGAPAEAGFSATAGAEGSGGGSTAKQAEGGGEKSIEEFGEEAEGDARTATIGAFHGYLEALATGDPVAACSHLAATVQRSLRQFSPRALRSKGCAAILPKVLAPSAPATAREQARGQITRVRVDGERGFVIFRAPGAKLYEMPMVRQPDGWKVGLVAAAVLVPKL